MTGVRIAQMDINIFTRIGFVVLVGLASKNAISDCRICQAACDQGESRRQATLEACRLRLRPIVMTSLAFILGVAPFDRWPRRRSRNAPHAGHGRVQRHAGCDGVWHFPDAGFLLHHRLARRSRTFSSSCCISQRLALAHISLGRWKMAPRRHGMLAAKRRPAKTDPNRHYWKPTSNQNFSPRHPVRSEYKSVSLDTMRVETGRVARASRNRASQPSSPSLRPTTVAPRRSRRESPARLKLDHRSNRGIACSRVLHRSADLRLGDVDRHRAGRRRGGVHAADRAVSRTSRRRRSR